MSENVNSFILALIIVFLVLTIPLIGIETRRLQEKDVLDLENIMDENEIFFKRLKGIEHDGRGHIYYLDGHFIRILKVNVNTFKLVDAISSKGQGPNELQSPLAFRIKGDKIFVYDLGFGGVKVFNLNGKLVTGIKIPVQSFSFGLFLYHIIDINSKNELYVRHLDATNNTAISVFDMNGKLKRQIITVEADRSKKMRKWFVNVNFEFLTDQEDNLVMLYKQGALLKKYTPDGKIVWSRDLYKDLPENLHRNTRVDVKKKGRSVNITNLSDFFGICFIDDEQIFVSCNKMGMVYDKSGKLLFRIIEPSGKGFGSRIVWIDGKLYSKEKAFKFTKN